MGHSKVKTPSDIKPPLVNPIFKQKGILKISQVIKLQLVTADNSKILGILVLHKVIWLCTYWTQGRN